jgi:hypothetical protein
MSTLFTKTDAWTGGSIDVLMFFPGAGVEHAIRVGRRLWGFASLDGPYRERTIEPASQPTADFTRFTSEGCEQLLGVMHYADGSCSPFIHTSIIDDDGLWVYAGPSLGGLPQDWGVGAYPFCDGRPITWLAPLYTTLRDLAQHVHSHSPVRVAAFGWLDLAAPDMLLSVLRDGVPPDRWVGLSLWDGDCPAYYAPTHSEAPMSIP